jgi:hypothetical protein
VVAAVNLGVRSIAGFPSEVLVLGVRDEKRDGWSSSPPSGRCLWGKRFSEGLQRVRVTLLRWRGRSGSRPRARARASAMG